MSAIRLIAAGVTVAFDGRPVLDRVDLVAEGGRWTTVTGPPGSGKSVLLDVLAGVRQPDAGSVVVEGAHGTGDGSGGADLAAVRQDYGLVDELTAAESVALPLQARRLPRSLVRERTRHWLHELGLTPAAQQLVPTLSGGQRQRVAIARALALQPAVLVLDEPTAELDALNRDVVVDLLRRAGTAGAAVVVATHDETLLRQGDAALRLGTAPGS